MTNEIPSNWRPIKLGDVCQRIDYGYTASADAEIKEPKFLRITDIQDGRVDWGSVPGCAISEADEDAMRLQDGDIVFARTGATTGKSYLLVNPPRAVFASYLIRLRGKKDVVEPEYLSAFFQSDRYWAQILKDTRGGAQPSFNASMLSNLKIPIASIAEQKRLIATWRHYCAGVERAREAGRSRLEAAQALPAAIARDSVGSGRTRRVRLRDCLTEVKNGVGESWSRYPVLGATRGGLAPAKEGVGKAPQRYKLVDPVTVFYNPMRILLGSIAVVDEGDAAGITSPDYVVVKGRPGVLDTRWFYYWFRSSYGASLIESLSRGAVRERILFNRLASGEIDLPDYETQSRASEQMKKLRPVVENIVDELKTIDALPSAILREALAGSW